jgi:hypothetical protein
MINLKKTGLMLVLALLVVAKTFSQSLKDAEYEFNKMSYLNAAETFRFRKTVGSNEIGVCLSPNS